MNEMNGTSGASETPVLALINQKGGVGKTTLTVHVAGALAARGLDVLVVDAAPEGALTSILGYDVAYEPNRDVTLHELILEPIEYADRVDDIIESGEEFDLLPANERMVDNTAKSLEGEPRARERLEMVFDTIDGYDIIVVDNAPSVNTLTDNALIASDSVLVPLYAEALSVQGLDRLQKQVQGIEQYYGDVTILGFVLNRVEQNNQSDAMVEQVRVNFGNAFEIFEIRKRVALQRPLASQQRSVFAVEESTDMEAVLENIAALAKRELLKEETTNV
ncbi:ParA family protein [Natronomonas amylolytica]|uniref:ParA family protein n=1 Tax=Natronomonas amylolytica TaxID=3108498 RepID=UPI00300888D0